MFEDHSEEKKDEIKQDEETKTDAAANTETKPILNSMKECNTKQIVQILNDYLFDEIKSEIMSHYKFKIVSYFEENDWNGIKLSKMSKNVFIKELIIRCDNNKKLRSSLAKLFDLFDFTEIDSESKCIQECEHKEIMHILKNYMFQKLDNQLLNENCNQIISYFVEHNLDGMKLFEMKRKQFCQNLIDHCQQNRKLNHCFILLYKEFFKMDLSQIDFSKTDEKQNNFMQLTETPKKMSKRRNNKESVEPQFTDGYRFYYWDYYQSDKWFIHQKYANLKEEILYNSVRSLNALKWDEAYNKATALRKSEIIKNIKCPSNKWLKTYKIAKDSALRLSHLLSLILYTDYTDLSFVFRKSFKKSSPFEDNQVLIERNGVFANWSRSIREAVECYGTKMKESQIDTFYYGMSEMYIFRAMHGRFYCPASCTTQLSVARIFVPNENGIILELEKYRNGLELTYFNCSLISHHSNEYERLFIGGYRPLQFRGIRIIHSNQNFEWFITAINIFDAFLNGKKIKGIKSTHYTIIHQLCKQQMSKNRKDSKQSTLYFRNKYPVYINQIFHRFCSKKKQICINLKYLNQCYPNFKSFFCAKPKPITMKQTKEKRVRFNMLSNDQRVESAVNSGNKLMKERRMRRHSYSGAMVQIDVISGTELFLIFKKLQLPIHVKTEAEGISYDVVESLPKLLFVYRLNEEFNPIHIDNQIKKEMASNVAVQQSKSTLIFIENPLYRYHLSSDFYIQHLLQILKYFFDSKQNDGKISHSEVNNSAIMHILKWRLSLYELHKKIKICPEIYEYFCCKRIVYLNVSRLRHCKEAKQCLLHRKCKRLCLINIVAAIFTKCEQITCCEIRTVSALYLNKFLVILQAVNQNKHSDLKHILFDKRVKMQCKDEEFEVLKQKFVRNNWKMTKKKDEENDNLYLCFDRIVLRRR